MSPACSTAFAVELHRDDSSAASIWSSGSGGDMSTIQDDVSSFDDGDAVSYVGTRTIWGGEKQFGLSAADRRHHLYCIGKTGTGKTTLLRNLILQDIYAGAGVGVIDPHGDLCHDLLDHIPRSRTEDVVFFNPADLEHPVGFNLLQNVPPERRHRIASGIVGAMKNIWRESWGSRMEYILYAAVAALLDCENTSILGIQRMLVDRHYRRWVVKQVTDPVAATDDDSIATAAARQPAARVGAVPTAGVPRDLHRQYRILTSVYR
jgi:hypothetical protein